ncbi:MAG: hypothetical protein HYX32_06410 [Actinobacteria bacterium]|nr:hypothetical protein [Actinomycetota bacterium]
MTAPTPRFPWRRFLVLLPLFVVFALPVGAAMAQSTTTTASNTTTAPTSVPVQPTVRPTPQSTLRYNTPTTTVPHPTTTYRVSTTAPHPVQTTVPFTTAPPTTPTTVAPTSTEAVTTTTTAPTTTTTPVKEAEASSSGGGGRLPLVVGGLLGVGAAIATLTFLFWRHTRPGYDDYYPYDDELDDAAAHPDALPVTPVAAPRDDDDFGVVPPVDAGIGGAATAAAATSVLTRSAYPPDDGASVVVKPLSELQGPRATSGDDSSTTSPPRFSPVDEAADVTGFGVAPAAVAMGVDATSGGLAGPDGDEVHGAFEHDEEYVEGGVEPDAVLDHREPSVYGIEDEHHDSGDDVYESEVDAYGEEDADAADDPEPDANEPAFDHTGFDDVHQSVADPAPVAGPPAPSAVTILGPMRPGKQMGADDNQVTLEPDPMEIVTLEDIEQARAGSRSGDPRG